MGCFTLGEGAAAPLYVASLSGGDKYLKNYTPGQFLAGTMTVAKDEHGKRVDTYKVRYVLNEGPKKDKATTAAAAAKKSSSTAPSSSSAPPQSPSASGKRKGKT